MNMTRVFCRNIRPELFYIDDEHIKNLVEY